MFSRHNDKSIVALSAELNDEADWKAGTLRQLVYHLDVSAFAIEPVAGLLAIGTSKGDVDIYGAPGVHIRLSISDGVKVTLLQFAISLSRLLCVDEQDRLSIWDLVPAGKPRLQKIINFRKPVTAMTLSPSHQHAFLALADGEVKTYDLLCTRISPYTMPNMWKLYEEKMLAGRSPASNSEDSVSQIPLDLLIHPRDLNLLFVVYGGGIILSDLTQRNTLRAYEFELPPGAPGGAGYHSPNILTPRKPTVTAFAIHPCGHLFAVGHADGSIAFWAIEDEDKPLLVRTFDEDDTNIINGDRLNEALSSPHKQDTPREPIFKLTWSGFPNSSDPRGGETTLTILGGLKCDEPQGITVYLLPPFNPEEPPTPPDSSEGLHPFFKAAMKESLKPANVYTYFTKGITQDFLLVPKHSPHFSGTWDPIAIILMSEYTGSTRAIEAYQFPPPSFTAKEAHASTSADPVAPPAEDSATSEGDATSPIDALTDELATTLEFMQETDDPHQLRLPPSLWSGPGGIIDGQLVVLERDAYETVVDERGMVPSPELVLNGGVAWVEDFQNEMKLMKLQPHRIFLTHHRDLTVRFQDLSAQILVSSDAAPLEQSFPNPMPALTIEVANVLADPAIATRTSPKFINQAQISSAHMATESLECAVALETGQVILYRLIHARAPHSLQDEELISLQHIPATPGQRFRPEFAILASMGPVTSLAISDVGFLAVAYASGSLFVIDMRGPKVMLRHAPQSKSSFLSRKDTFDPFVSLTWTVSGTASDPSYHILLIATHDSGSTTIFTALRSQSGTWMIKDGTESADATPRPVPGGSVVIDSKHGGRCKANRSGLAAVLASSPDDEIRKTIWVSAGAKGARCVVNLTGEKFERVEWPNKTGKVERVEVVHKNAAAVLVAFTDRRQALVYSLPFLEHLHTVQMEETPTDSLHSDATGDYVQLTRHPASGLISQASYGTLFNIRRSGPYEPPSVILTADKRVIPAQPQPVSVGPTSYFTSWLGYITTQGMTGDQVDALLAGPDRPIAQPTPKDRVIVQDADRNSTPRSAYAAYGAQAQGMAASAATTASNLYTRLGAAFAERTENLGQLQESFDSLEQGSRKMLAQSKTLAAKQTAKRWFGF